MMVSGVRRIHHAGIPQLGRAGAALLALGALFLFPSSFFLDPRLVLAQPQAERSAPLPDRETFLRKVREGLRADRDLLSQYTYIERREEVKVSALGEIEEGPVKVYEVRPGLEPGNTWKRLIAVDGVPVPPDELAKADRKHAEDVRRERERRARETPRQRQRRLEKEAEEQQQRAAVVDEIFEAFEIRLTGRETVAGHRMLVAVLEPRPDHRPRTDQGELMKNLRVTAWVSEADYQLARVEAEVIEDITRGWGLVGRLHKGSRGVYERRRINDEIWLPAREEIRATGRALIFRTFDLHTVTEWSEHRKVAE